MELIRASRIAPKKALQRPQRSRKPSISQAARPKTTIALIRGIIPRLVHAKNVVNPLGKNPPILLRAPMMAPASNALMGLSISTPTGGILEITNRLTPSTEILISNGIMDVPHRFGASDST
jgi:hypothetical protein